MSDTGTRLFPYVRADQRDLAQHLGLWTFLATEVLFFGGLFAAYAVYRHAYPEAFAQGSHHLDFWIGTINTAVLLTSSLGMALADRAVHHGARRQLGWLLFATAILGVAFLVLKGTEYHQKFAEHLVPGIDFHPEGRSRHGLELFFFLYFVLTAIHALHLIIGIGALGWLICLNARGRLSADRHAPVSMVGLYWHFVDGVWVFLYPLLYLIVR